MLHRKDPRMRDESAPRKLRPRVKIGLLGPAGVFLVALAITPLLASPALAFDETHATGWGCAVCHDGATVLPQLKDPFGPHGGYTTTSNKCNVCHTLHAAPTGFKLLPGSTITDTCFTCHDGTGGDGVYSSQGTVLASHRVDTTNTVPGGDPTTGASVEVTFSSTAVGAEGTLTCTDCHSPHASSTVATFTGDRRRTAGPWAAGINGRLGDRLLRTQPGGIDYEIPEYGADWCAACHRGRTSTGLVHNHPVESTQTADAYIYDTVARVTTYAVSVTETGSLGSSNFGYVMPYPRTADQSGHSPICQQCHEDARNVGDVAYGQVATSEAFWPGIDGSPPNTNPALQNFPHESRNPSFLVETDDDLCTNCHPPSGLP